MARATSRIDTARSRISTACRRLSAAQARASAARPACSLRRKEDSCHHVASPGAAPKSATCTTPLRPARPRTTSVAQRSPPQQPTSTPKTYLSQGLVLVSCSPPALGRARTVAYGTQGSTANGTNTTAVCGSPTGPAVSRTRIQGRLRQAARIDRTGPRRGAPQRLAAAVPAARQRGGAPRPPVKKVPGRSRGSCTASSSRPRTPGVCKARRAAGQRAVWGRSAKSWASAGRTDERRTAVVIAPLASGSGGRPGSTLSRQQD